MGLYFSGQGKCYMATQVNGVPGPFAYVGNVPNLKIQPKTEVIEHQESFTGNRLQDLRITKSEMVSVDFTLEEFITDNLIASLFGTNPTMSGATITGETFPTGITPAAVAAQGSGGMYVRLANPNVSALVIHDSSGTGSGATLVSGTDYVLPDATFGTVQFLSGMGTGYVQPFKANYTAGAVSGNVPMFTSQRVQRWLRFVGLNTANNSEPVMIELYKVSFDPTKELDAINDALDKLELSGSALYDFNVASGDTTGVLGGFGRIMTIAAH